MTNSSMFPGDNTVSNGQVITILDSSSEVVETVVIKARGTSTPDPPAIGDVVETRCHSQHYPSMSELGDILVAALKAHEMLWSHGILHRSITFDSVMMLAAAQHDDNPEILEALYRSGDLGRHREDVDEVKVLAPEDVFTDSIVRTDPSLLTASELLRGTDLTQCVHTVSHDLESFDWVALYAIYRHALQTLPAGIRHPLHGPLLREFTRLFATTSTRTLLEGRTLAFGIEGSGESTRWQSASTRAGRGLSNPLILVDPRTRVAPTPAICGGIRSLMAYAAEVAKSQRLHAFLIGVWIELKVTFEGPPRLVPRPRDRHMRKVYRHIARRFPNAPAVVRGIGIINLEVLGDSDEDGEGSDDEGVVVMNGDSREDSAELCAPVGWGYTHEDLAKKLGIFVGKEI